MYKRMTKKERRDKFIAKCIYNVLSILYAAFLGGCIAAISTLGVHFMFPEVDFYDYLIIVGIVVFFLMFVAVYVAAKTKSGVYHLLCKIEKMTRKK